MLMEERKWHEKTWIIVLLIFVFFPIGLFLFFKNKYYSITSKIIVIILIALGVVTSDNKPADNATQQIAVNTFSIYLLLILTTQVHFHPLILDINF